MLWMVTLITLLPLVFYLADGDWGLEQSPEDSDWDSTAPDLLAQVMAAGTEAEPVWGAWLRVHDFDAASDVLMIDVPEGAQVHLSSSASAEGDTYLMLSDGTRIVLERVAALPCLPEDIVFFLHR